MHEGHRKRMLTRLEQGGALQDHELLEVLLFNAVPRKNTNPLAHELLAAFSSLEGVLGAGTEELMSVKGVGPETAAYLRCIGLVFARAERRRSAPPKLFSAESFSSYVRGRFAALGHEVVEIYCIDAREQVRFCKRFDVGTEDKAVIPPEEITRLLALHAPAGLVAAHNHPAKEAQPSEDDDRFTARLQVLCGMNNVRLYDHIVTGTDGTYSYFLTGRLEEIKRKFDVSRLVGGGSCP